MIYQVCEQLVMYRMLLKNIHPQRHNETQWVGQETINNTVVINHDL